VTPLRAFILALSLASTPALAAGDGAAMQDAAKGFYGVYQTLHPSDGVPGDAVRARFAPFLSPVLGALLQQAGGAEDSFAKANKNSPPLAEGDLFTSLFEGATNVSVGDCSGNDRQGRCPVSLTYAAAGAKPVTWTDAVLLVRTPGGWRVDDVVYGGIWAFGNKGTLSETLRQVIGFGNEGPG
jgi:hypothetical protein